MFGDGMQKNELPLIIVCDDKDMLTQRIIGCWILKNSVKNTVPTSSPRA